MIDHPTGTADPVIEFARARVEVVASVLAAAGLAWWSTAARMAGMDAGPGTSLGSLGWFLGVWAVMMAAMMLPSLAPTTALVATLTGRRDPSRWLLFVAGYLLVWSVAGVLAYGLYELGHSLLAHDLAWHRAGRWVAASVLALAALYELTPVKAACLTRCRHPARFLHEPAHEARAAALVMGARNGGWCLGSSAPLMAALFALGVMSLTWMAVIAGLVMLEKLVPWRRSAIVGVAVVLLLLEVGIAVAPHDVPGLVVPGGSSSMHMMGAMP